MSPGTGVHGEGNPGVRAISEAGLALEVEGRSSFIGLASFAAGVESEATVTARGYAGAGGSAPSFNGSGTARIPKGEDLAVVENIYVNRRTSIVVTFQSDPGEISVKHVRALRGKFEVVLSGPLSAPARIAYIVFAS